MANPEVVVKPAQKKEADEDTNVICKMYVKGKPNNLIEIIKNILMPLNVKGGGGYYSETATDNYALTILVEKIKK